MALFTASETVSPFPAQNALYNGTERMQAYRQNELLQQSKQQEIGATDQEMVARAAAYLNGLPEDQRASAYGPIVQDLQSRGFAKQAPSTYPGHERIAALASMGTPSKDTLAIGASQAAKSALYPGPGASAAPAGGGVAPAGNVDVPPELLPHFQAASAETGIPVPLLVAQAKQESGFNPNATGAAGEIGIMQIKPSTATTPGFGMTGVDPATLRDPAANIRFGAQYLKARGGNADWNDPVARDAALASYNGGGDPNYAANVTRNLSGGGVAARTGGVDVAGPGAPAPASTVPGAPAVLPNGLTREQDRQMQVLRTTRGVTSEELLAAQERFRAGNRAEEAAARVAAHQATEDARQAANDKTMADERARKAAQEGVPPGYRMVDGKAERIPGLPQDENVAKQDNQRFQQENTLRDEFGKLTADFRVVQTSYENIRSAARAKDGASDMSLLYSYVKLLDPTSVVRESEFGAAAASGSFGERIQGAAERILSGARMPESLRDSFVREAGNLYGNQLRSHNDIADKYETLAKSNGLDPAKVVTRFARPQDNPETGAISVKTAEDYAKVPPGADYTDPDGHVRRKPK